MKKQSIFHRGLYLDTLRQLRVMGIAYTSVSLLISVLPALIALSSGDRNQVVGLTVFTPVLLGVMTLGAMTLVFEAFSFLFSRGGSDNFHSLPIGRTSLCLSRFLAAVTWLVGIIVVTAVGTALVNTLVFPGQYFSYLPSVIAYYGVCALFFAASSLIAISITGTRFSAFCVTMLVAFVLRFLLLMMGIMMLWQGNLLSMRGFGLLLNPAFQVATGTVFQGVASLIQAGGFTRLMSDPWPLLYTLLVGIAYAGVGVWAFTRRKSELAQRSAPSRTMQAVYRCGVTLPVVMPFAMTAVLMFREPASGRAVSDPVLLVGLVLSFVVFMVFEVITQRTFKTLLRILPSYAVLIALCLAFSGASAWAGENAQHKLAKVENIKSVSLLNETGSYYDLVLEGAMLEQPAMKQLFADALAHSVSLMDRRTNTSDEVHMLVHIRQQGHPDLVRNVWVTSAQQATIGQALMQNEAVIQQLRTLASPQGNKTFSLRQLALSQAQMNQLVTVLDNELKQMEGQALYDLINQGDAGLDYLIIEGTLNQTVYTQRITLNAALPATLRCYLELANQLHQQNLQGIVSSRRTIHEGGFNLYDLSAAPGPALDQPSTTTDIMDPSAKPIASELDLGWFSGDQLVPWLDHLVAANGEEGSLYVLRYTLMKEEANGAIRTINGLVRLTDAQYASALTLWEQQMAKP